MVLPPRFCTDKESLHRTPTVTTCNTRLGFVLLRLQLERPLLFYTVLSTRLRAVHAAVAVAIKPGALQGPWMQTDPHTCRLHANLVIICNHKTEAAEVHAHCEALISGLLQSTSAQLGLNSCPSSNSSSTLLLRSFSSVSYTVVASERTIAHKTGLPATSGAC
jgi:hypothetical protein